MPHIHLKIKCKVGCDTDSGVLAHPSTSTLKPTGGDARPSIEYIESISP